MEIVLFVCLISDPRQCTQQRLPEILETNNPYQCSAVSPLYAARWAGEHPGWKIVRWRCGPAGGHDL